MNKQNEEKTTTIKELETKINELESENYKLNDNMNKLKVTLAAEAATRLLKIEELD